MPIYLLFILLILSITVSTQFIYVNENNANSSPDGSKENPYTKVEDAINNFTPDDTDIVLLGDSVTLTETIDFPVGVVCTIRPDVIPESQYFPFYLAPGAGLASYLSNFTMQNLHIFELDQNRDYATNPFQMIKGTLTFNRTYIANIFYGDSAYMLVWGGEDYVFDATMTILDSRFENLNNVQLFLTETRVVIRNSSFDNITTNIGGFITLYQNWEVDANLTVTNTSITNSRFDYQMEISAYFKGFIQSSNSTINIYFDGLFVKNVTLVNGTPLIWLDAISEDADNPTTATILNTVVEDVFEFPDSQVPSQDVSMGLIFQIAGTTTINLTNFTANNVQFNNDSMVALSPNKDNYYYSWSLLPSVTISNVKISNSARAHFIIMGLDSALIENIELTNISCPSFDVALPIFYFYGGSTAIARNFYGKDVYSAVLRFSQFYSQTVENLTFYNISTNQQFRKGIQNILQLTREASISSEGFRIPSYIFTHVSNFNVFGFQAIDAISNKSVSNDTYMIVANDELGEMTIKDCYWYNNQMGSFLSTSMNNLTIDNLTVDADPGLVSETLPWHRVFQMVNMDILKFKNCRFSNIQNIVIFNFFNIQRSQLYAEVDVIDMVFENITVTNNYANYWTSDTLYLSLFSFNSPLKPYKATFNNSYFNHNKISSGVIFTLESYQAEVIIQNCIFEDNFAKMGGAVFAARTMQDNQNIFTLINNTFRNNSVAGSGGVFSFVNTWYSVTASNNIYINNNATANGGVGYVFSSKLTFFEQNALYQNGYAGKLGGSWYLSTSNQEDSSGNIRPITFFNSTFKNSRALQSGGAIYTALGNLKITQCNFQNNTAAISGGDFFMVTFSSFAATNSNFSRGYALQGAFLHADSLSGEVVAIKHCRIEHYGSISPTQTLIELNSGWLYVSDSVLNNISMPLFKLEATSALFQNVTMNQVTCTSSSYYFCILQGTVMSLSISDVTITDVVSNTDLIVLNSPEANSTIDSLEVTGVTTTLTSGSTRNTLKQLFALRLYSAPQVIVQNSVFESFINFSSIIVEKSAFELIGSKFSNKNSRRLLLGLDVELPTNLQESTQSTEVSVESDYVSDAEFSQFLVFTTSNATITKSSFSYNSGVPVLNGGAMKILGDSSTTGNYQILNSTFTGNQGYQGGAISVQGPFNNLTIENSNFTSNAADTNGGSIYFANSSVRLVPKIANSIFKSNQAESGGAIFVGNQPLYIQSSTFDSNSARDGGAIASFSESSHIVTLNQSLFEDNTAYVGAALRALGTTNFDTATSTFEGNTAEIGGDLATNPTQLRLVIYEVDEYFLFLETIDAAYMLSHSGTRIIYDSKDPDSYDIIYQKSGRNPNYIFQFTFLDQLGENLPIIEEANVRISIKDYIVPRGSITPGFLGTGVYQFNDTTGYLFNSFSIRGNETSVITLSAQGSFNNTFIDQIETLTPLNWQITLGPCSIGEYYDEVNLLCTPCSSGTYSLEDPYNISACHKCPDDMKCLGSDIYFPVEGYWRISATSDNIVQCFNSEACLGGQQDSDRDVSLTGFCGAGYHGVACGSCDPGYAKFGTSQKCVNCSKNAGYYIRFILYLAIQILIIIFATKTYLDKSDPNVEDFKSALIKAALMKIIIDFVQVLNMASEFDFRWPNQINDFLEAITKLTPTNKDALSVDCFITLAKGDNYDIFFIKLLLLVLQPILFIAIATLIWMIIFRIQKKPIMSNPALRTRLIMTSIVIVYVLQPGIIKSTFQLFNCANFGPTDDPAYYLVEDTNVQCWEPKHVTWTLALGIPSLIIWLIIPSVYLLYIVIRRKVTKNPEAFARTYNVVFDTYREKHFYWEIVILLRKVLIIIFTVFLTYTYLQAYLSLITLIAAYTAQTFFKPFIYPSLNRAEKLSIFATGFILYSALFFVRTDGNDSLVPLFLALDVIIGVIFLLYCLVIATRALKGRIARIKQRWRKFVGIDGISKPGFVGKTIRKLLPEKPNTNGRQDLITVHKEKQPLDTECDNLHRETEITLRASVKHPSMVELLDPRINRIRPLRSCSSEGPEDFNDDPRLRSMKSIDDNMMKIFSVRGTETDLLNSFRVDSRRGSLRHQPSFPSQILDLDDRAGSIQNIGLDVVVEEAPTATLKKDMLKDNRFKEIDKVEIRQNIEEEEPDFAREHIFRENLQMKLKKESLKDDRFKDIDKLEIQDEAAQMTTMAGVSSPLMKSEEEKDQEQEENKFEENPAGVLRKETLKDERFKDLDKVEIQFEDEGNKDVVRKITMFTEEDEMIPLSALKDEDFRNSIDTNSLDVAIQKEQEEEEAASANNVNRELNYSEERSHEVMSLSAIDPNQSDEGEEIQKEGELNEVSNTRNESSESPDVMTLSGVFGKHERHEPHSAA